MARYGYYADLRSIQFSENQSWITAMRVGEYQHPVHGKISFTPDRLKRFADSVKNKVRGIELDIDYDHKQDPTKGNEAAGWVKDAVVEGDSLKLLVDWTQTAVSKIKEKAYRYFSPDFQDDWTDASGVKHEDVLFGGGITNRPFLKDLLPVNLSELTFTKQLTDDKKEGNGMTEEQLKLLGLPKDATEEQINAKLQSVTEAAKNPHGTVDHTATTHGPNNRASDTQPKLPDGAPYDATTAGRVDADGNAVTPEEFQLSELAKTSPALAAMMRLQMQQNKQLSEQVSALAQSNKVNEIRVKLNEYRTGDKILAPALLDEAASILAKTPVQLHEDIHKLLKTVQGGTATVQLGELGHTNGSTSTAGGKSASDTVQERVGAKRKLFSEGGSKGTFSDADAMMDIFAEDPELFSKYQEESYLFKA
jgi:Mu-like prophage I protein